MSLAVDGGGTVGGDRVGRQRRGVVGLVRRALLLDVDGRPDGFYALSAVTFLLWTGSSILIPVLPVYAVSLGLTFAQSGLVIGAFYAGRLVFNLVGGGLSDRSSLRFVAAIGCVASAAASIAAGLVETFPGLLVARFAQGAGAGIYLTAALAAVVRGSPPALVGRLSSLYQGIGLLGFTFGPVLGGVLSQYFGPRSPFFGYAVAALLGAGISLTRVPGRDDRSRRVAEGRRPDDEADRVLRGPLVLAMLVAAVSFGLRAGILNTLVPLLAATELAMTDPAVGGMFALAGVANIAVLGRAGRRLDVSRRHAVLLGTTGSGVFILLSGLSPDGRWLTLWCLLAMASTGYASVAPPVLVADSLPRALHGRGVGVLRIVTDLALLIAPYGAGLVADTYGLRVAIMLAGGATLATSVLLRSALIETGPIGEQERPPR